MLTTYMFLNSNTSHCCLLTVTINLLILNCTAAPTRELAKQIIVECDKFGHTSDIKNTAVYGGAPKRNQMMDLQRVLRLLLLHQVCCRSSACIETLHLLPL
jgi:hypothetical protein